MGNSSLCMSKSKEVECQANEVYQARISEFKIGKSDVRKDTKMDVLLNEMSLKMANKELKLSVSDNVKEKVSK